MRIRLIVCTFLAFAFSGSCYAADYSAGELQISHPWTRELPPNSVAGATYVTVHNHGATEDRLIAAKTPRAAKAEIHTMLRLGNVIKMQKLDSVGIPSGGEIKLTPGGTHLMLFGLQEPLVAGEHFPLTLQFEKAGEVEVEVVIESSVPTQ